MPQKVRSPESECSLFKINQKLVNFKKGRFTRMSNGWIILKLILDHHH